MSKTTPSQDLRNAKLASDPTCSKCGETKTVKDFPTIGVDYWCRSCRRKYAVELYRKKMRSMSEAELSERRAIINARQNASRLNRRGQMSQEELAEYKKKINRDNQKRRDEIRDRVYRAYGGYRCSCCGETERMFLSIDHINNDGAKHRRDNRLNSSEQMYRWIARNGFPDGFQILCMNCQWGKRNNSGVCPHSGKV